MMMGLRKLRVRRLRVHNVCYVWGMTVVVGWLCLFTFSFYGMTMSYHIISYIISSSPTVFPPTTYGRTFSPSCSVEFKTLSIKITITPISRPMSYSYWGCILLPEGVWYVCILESTLGVSEILYCTVYNQFVPSTGRISGIPIPGCPTGKLGESSTIEICSGNGMRAIVDKKNHEQILKCSAYVCV